MDSNKPKQYSLSDEVGPVVGQNFKYLSVKNRKRLLGYWTIVKEFWSKNCGELFQIGSDLEVLAQVLSEAMERDNHKVAQVVLNTYHLQEKAQDGYDRKHPIYIGT